MLRYVATLRYCRRLLNIHELEACSNINVSKALRECLPQVQTFMCPPHGPACNCATHMSAGIFTRQLKAANLNWPQLTQLLMLSL